MWRTRDCLCTALAGGALATVFVPRTPKKGEKTMTCRVVASPKVSRVGRIRGRAGCGPPGHALRRQQSHGVAGLPHWSRRTRATRARRGRGPAAGRRVWGRRVSRRGVEVGEALELLEGGLGGLGGGDLGGL